MEDKQVVRALAALAQEMRLSIFRALVVAGQEGMTPGALREQLDCTPAALSFHLKELVNADLLTQERNGRYLIYRASYASMNDLLRFLTDNCCAGQECPVNVNVTCR